MLSELFSKFVSVIDFVALRAKAQAKGEEYQPGWKWTATFVDGRVEELTDLAFLHGHQARLGVDLLYGMRPEGYDAPVIGEKGWGGAISVAYFFKNGVRTPANLMVAVLEEGRNGHPVLNLPRAFLKPGQQYLTLAEQTLREEFGLAEPFETEPLFGAMNSNSAFFFNEAGEGCRFYAMRIDERALEVVPENGHYRFKNQVVPVDPKDAGAKKLLGSVFMPAGKIIRHMNMEDLFTAGGIGLLKEYLFPTE